MSPHLISSSPRAWSDPLSRCLQESRLPTPPRAPPRSPWKKARRVGGGGGSPNSTLDEGDHFDEGEIRRHPHSASRACLPPGRRILVAQSGLQPCKFERGDSTLRQCARPASQRWRPAGGEIGMLPSVALRVRRVALLLHTDEDTGRGDVCLCLLPLPRLLSTFPLSWTRPGANSSPRALDTCAHGRNCSLPPARACTSASLLPTHVLPSSSFSMP